MPHHVCTIEYMTNTRQALRQPVFKGYRHNLRPLEVLQNEFLIYTTVNPNNRYIKSAYIKNTQNTRLSYLRSIKLGGQKEKLYNETNIYEMELAMRYKDHPEEFLQFLYDDAFHVPGTYECPGAG